jgi:tetratricopeptide (TPR) repeat protein
MLGEQRALAAIWNNLGAVAQGHGDLTRAEQSYQQSLAIRVRIGEQPALGGVWSNLGAIATMRGEYHEAAERFRRAMDILEQTGPPEYVAGTLIGLGDLAFRRAEYAAAARWCRKARRLSREAELPDAEALAFLGMSRAHLHHPCRSARRINLANALLDRARHRAAMHGLAEPAVEAALLEAEIHLIQGAIALAEHAAGKALGLATVGQRRLCEARARLLLGQCALASGGQAGPLLHAAGLIFEELGATQDAARSRELAQGCLR